MTVEEARQVVWSRKGTQEAFGNRLDSKEIGPNDLAYAVEHGQTPKVRAAARTLLAYWLGKPTTLETTQRYGPQVFEGSRYLVEKKEESLILASGWVGMLSVSLIFLCFMLFQDLRRFSTAPGYLVGLAIGLVLNISLFGYGFFSVRKELLKYRSFRDGKEGEDATVERLRVTLDNKWTIFRNLHLPNHNDDLDIVLVGPGGVWVLEVKAYGGTVRVENQIWERQVKGGWKRLSDNPSRQAGRNAARLNDFLKRQGIERWVEKTIVMAEPQPISGFETSEVPVWLLPQVEDKVALLSTRTPPTEKEIGQIVDFLKGLAAKAKR